MKFFAALFIGLLITTSAIAQTGSAKTAAELNTEVSSNLASGQTPAITAAQLRQVFLDLIASSLGPSSGVIAAPNTVLAGPVAGTTSAAATFRALVAADIPGGGGGGGITVLPTLAALQAYTNVTDGLVVTTSGYRSAGDGGSATYVYCSACSMTAVGVFIFAPPSGGGRWIMQIPAEGVHPEVAGAYCDYDRDTFAGHDDAAALNNLSNYIQNSAKGTGTIIQNFGKACLVDSVSFTVRRGVTLKGVGQIATANGGNQYAIVPFIVVNPSFSLVCGPSSSVENLVVMRKNLAQKPADMLAAYTYQTATILDSSIGISANGSDCKVKDAMVIGFNTGMKSTGGARLVVDGLYCDDYNCIDVTTNADTSFISRVRGYPFWAFNLGGRKNIYSGTVVAGGAGYADGNILTVPGGTCTIQPTFTASGSGAVTALTVNNPGDCTVVPTTYGINSVSDVSIISGGSAYAATSNFNVTVATGTGTAAVVNVGTSGGGVVTTINSITTAGSYPVTNRPVPENTPTGGSGSGLILSITTTKNPIALTGGAGTGATALINTQQYSFRGGVCVNIHEQYDGGLVNGAECQAYQTQCRLSNIWNVKVWYCGGEGGSENYDHHPTGVLTENCAADITLFNPNTDVNYIGIDLQHRTAANGGSCVGATNGSAEVQVLGGHIGYNSGTTLAAIRMGPGSYGSVRDVMLGWQGTSVGWPASIQLQANAGQWDINNVIWDFTPPTQVQMKRWISVDPTARVPTSNQFAYNMQGSLARNGDFMVDQQNAGASGSTTPRIDGWRVNLQTAGAGISTQQTTASPPTGFSYSLKLTAGTGNAPGAAERNNLSQKLEGSYFQGLGWGTVNAIPITIDWCAKASTPGNYSWALLTSGQNISYVHSQALTTSFQCFSTVIPGPAIGSWPTTPGSIWGLFTLDGGTGANGQTTSTDTWQTASVWAHSGDQQLVATTGATLSLGAFHIRPGAFLPNQYVPRPFDQELAFARRYYQTSIPAGTAVGQNKGILGASCVQNPIAAGQPSMYMAFNPPMVSAPTTVTTYNPSAANASWRDVTASADVAVTVDPSTAASTSGVQIATGATVANLADNLCIHWSADSGF